ncbi:MAG TPA: DUF222 domain-containing protein [Jiangellaceae bacterium]|nr:DUF222 domain-containing protein [Jiangellaceae bacterium]
MFGSMPDERPAGGGPVVRVSFAALAVRPQGFEAAFHAVQLAVLTRRDAADADAAAGVDEAVAVEHDLVERVAAVERVKARGDAAQLRAMAELARRPMFAGCAEHGHGDPAHGVRGAASVVSAELRLSPAAAVARVALACELVAELPATLAELDAGRIDGYRARVIAEQTRPLAPVPELRRQVETTLLAKAYKQTATQLRAAARKAVMAADPASAAERHQKARAGRFVSAPCPELDGMASLFIRMPAEDAVALYTAIDAAARLIRRTADSGSTDSGTGVGASGGDQRTLDEVRADVLAGLGWSALLSGHLGCCHPDCAHVNQPLASRRGKPVTVNVTVAYTTLIGADKQPAYLDGYGPICADVARRIAADGVWRRILTDPATGAVLDVGRQRYTPPLDLAEHVIVRDRSCRFATCTRAAEGCDLDHTIPWEQGGVTSAGDLGPLHRGHHNDKTHHGWRLEQPEPGRFTWTAPTGHVYQVDPEIVGLLALPPPAPAEENPPADPDPPPF